jgi:hypothetical protein
MDMIVIGSVIGGIVSLISYQSLILCIVLGSIIGGVIGIYLKARK